MYCSMLPSLSSTDHNGPVASALPLGSVILHISHSIQIQVVWWHIFKTVDISLLTAFLFYHWGKWKYLPEQFRGGINTVHTCSKIYGSLHSWGIGGSFPNGAASASTHGCVPHQNHAYKVSQSSWYISISLRCCCTLGRPSYCAASSSLSIQNLLQRPDSHITSV
jgi:hypothetical protein